MLVSEKNFREVIGQCNAYQATCIAVTKTRPIEVFQEFQALGHNIFGENRVDALLQRQEELADDVYNSWHFIGHLQRKKVVKIAHKCHLIHSADSLKLLNQINLKASSPQKVLLQFHIAQEESKYGMKVDTLEDIISSIQTMELNNLQIAGVMGMATYTDDRHQIEREFKTLRKTFEYLKPFMQSISQPFETVSMGMSNDYKIALDHGSTMVRIGSYLYHS
ncbi:MAG TPA: YggS family pyridoxal phosphate-dependent enzyme [Bacteroidetes bacterium]|nr:YggS family pyridoxal phosphate-dependent enzyme [Bacteroidota bacterium]|tara:strand:+ start:851 stop:1513 length:663 start_codon:yes stop_codon:yes gene_type:complete